MPDPLEIAEIKISVRFPSHKELRDLLKPYAYQVGLVVYEWNNLQETLAELFWVASGVSNGAVTYAIWNSIANDRTQRGMLRAIIEWRFAEDNRRRADLIWLLKRVDSLAERRNNAIHAPFVVIGKSPKPALKPHSFHGNRRAIKLENKDIIKEFKLCREFAKVLHRYAHRVLVALRDPQKAWPDRPEMP
jgi:hypothetical protein